MELGVSAYRCENYSCPNKAAYLCHRCKNERYCSTECHRVQHKEHQWRRYECARIEAVLTTTSLKCEAVLTATSLKLKALLQQKPKRVRKPKPQVKYKPEDALPIDVSARISNVIDRKSEPRRPCFELSCLKSSAPLQCHRCKKAWYCNITCQTKHAHFHKAVCIPFELSTDGLLNQSAAEHVADHKVSRLCYNRKCRKPASVMCDTCKSAWYCRKECQKSHRKAHKSVCVAAEFDTGS